MKRWKIQFGAEEIYILDLACGEGALDWPPQYAAQIQALAETHPCTREPCDFEADAVLTFYLEDDELPIPFSERCYFYIDEAFLTPPGEPSRCWRPDGATPI